jgi:hypothetical protein
MQMSASENYDGFLTVTNPWAAAILVKHLVIGGMILVGVYLQWSVQPALARLATLEAHGRAAGAELEAARRRQAALMRLNLALGIAVLGLTALARVL